MPSAPTVRPWVSWLAGGTVIYRGPGKSKEIPLLTTGTTISSKVINIDLDITDQTADLDPNGTPAWLRKQMVSILASTAVLGIAAFMFIDNAAHLGGALSGAALGYAVCRWGAHRQREFDAAGLAATVVLAAGAVFTVTRLLFA